MGRFIALLYGIAAYAVFFVTFLYAVAFVGDMPVPKTIDSGAVAPLPESLIVNLILLSLFAVQHSVMARPAFKNWWTRFVPKSVERSTRAARRGSLALVVLFWQWRPLPTVFWHIDHPQLALAATALSHLGSANRAQQHVPDQSFRTVWLTPGRQRPNTPADCADAVPHAAVL